MPTTSRPRRPLGRAAGCRSRSSRDHHPAPSSIAIGWPAGTTASSSRPPNRPRWKINGSPPPWAIETTSPSTRAWSPATLDPLDAAAQDCRGAGDRQEPLAVALDVSAGERRAGLGEVERDLPLPALEDAHREPTARGRGVKRARAVPERDEDEKRVERDRRERVERHAGQEPLVLGGDDGNPGGELADAAAERADERLGRFRAAGGPFHRVALPTRASRARACA